MVKFFCFNPAMLDTKEGFPTIHMHLLWLVVSINLQRLTYWWGQLDNYESNLEKSILGTLCKGAPSLEIAPQISAQKQDTLVDLLPPAFNTPMPEAMLDTKGGFPTYASSLFWNCNYGQLWLILVDCLPFF